MAIKEPNKYKREPVPKRTSIGHSNKSRPLNKHKRRGWKPPRGQGNP